MRKMVLNSYQKTGIIILTLLIVVYFLMYFNPTIKAVVTGRKAASKQLSNLYVTDSVFIEQRNNLSRLLNLKQKKIQQMACKKVAHRRIATSETGGWCRNPSKEDSGEHVTDIKLIKALTYFFEECVDELLEELLYQRGKNN